MSWQQYSFAFLLFNGIGFVVLFLLQIVQGPLPLNPQGLGAVRWDTALNTAISFVTNTNWQAYGGESTMSYLTQMLGMTVQNFLSAAIGIAVMLPLVRAFVYKLKADGRKLLGGHDPGNALRPAPHEHHTGRRACVTRRGADLRTLREGPYPGGRRAGDRRGPCRLPDGDQAVRLKRWRLL